MFGEEAEKLADKLDMTPTRATRPPILAPVVAFMVFLCKLNMGVFL